ncbi:nicotinate phosphoribosyltransferase [Hydrogenibacillus schlegelii]|uniref:Nicotinate phosphoribosyltransferase n=1 Tax=Hydrogenibacillus schlegelii TaxID=1484 RepID=A0A132MQJ1_HYDSH|nr:nicotinate phosphoribosyltransferase [Hydrogenibacillus schlegelii]KWX00006.1 nicotinate phosphoribosyltransferase [Hydrogenibacillus schlegelii]MBT9283611.1 nicotinate phosphoribosyltransferase [Hydrogenibacillus schlegelii]OAR05084.1 nicotinate phosphoribosyltransferase [Hydrogenibacillus schlegelii]PTQ52958.1 MAG: Nicotinate phosphoribosyltransferase [Hydrogenibacillus schlegelii]
MGEALWTDFYQLNMMYAHFRRGSHETPAVFDVFFRRLPCEAGFGVFAGLEAVLDWLEAAHFTDEELGYLAEVGGYDRAFLEYLRGIRFRGTVWAVPEGTPVFPHEPLLRIEAPIGEAHWVETAILAYINHQTLIATKAARIVHAAGDDPVLEFGLRRSHGPEAGVYAARAAYIAGAQATSNVEAGRRFGIPVVGTHAHAFVQSFPDERAAFDAFLAAFPDQAILLVDTYDVLRSGLPNAIEAFRAHFARLGRRPARYGVRIDSGDLAYLSKAARAMLDAAGFSDAIVVASGDLDETIIRDLKVQGARIDAWGVGTELVTGGDCGALGAVYKLSAIREGDRWVPKLKVSENPLKINDPGVKKVVRFYDRDRGEALADVILLEEEPLPEGPYEIFHPIYTMKRKTLRNYETRLLLEPVMVGGRRLHPPPSAEAVRRYHLSERERFAPEVRRLVYPHEYPVDLSLPLWELKQRLVREQGGRG